MFGFKINGKAIEESVRDEASFLNSQWKFAKDQTKKVETKVTAPPVEPPQGDIVPPVGEDNNLQNAPEKYTQASLKQLSKQDVQEIASSFGIANLEIAKDKLIDQILEKQS